MALTRWRRVTTGLAAGLIVLVAALIGASMRSDTNNVAVATDTRPATVIPVPEDDDIDSADTNSSAASDEDTAEDDGTDGLTEPVRVIDEENLPAETATPATADEADADAADTGDGQADGADDAGDAGDAEADTGDNETDGADDADNADDAAAEDSAAEDSAAEDSTAEADAASDTAEDSSDAAPTQPPPAPLAAGDSTLGTGGGVDDAECAIDRLVIYAGARVGGVAGSLRSALVRNGFGAACAEAIEIRASNCPLQFSGVLAAGSGYDPTKSFIASSANVNRETLAAVLGETGYSGSAVDILGFDYVNERPNDRWIALFIPPSFAGWETLSAAAQVPATSQSLCAPSGRLAG